VEEANFVDALVVALISLEEVNFSSIDFLGV